MDNNTLQQAILSRTEQNMLNYFATHDVQYMTEDVVFKSLNTGETYKGRAEVGAMLHYFYQVAFDAKAVVSSYIITEEKAQVEGHVRGRHIGEFAGIQPTNREVNVPICVTYDLQNGLIREGRIFLLMDVLFQQLGGTPASHGPKTTYLVRDIFHLKFGQYRGAKKLLDEAVEKRMLPEAASARVLTDFTGDAYRLIFEEGFDSLTDYELSLNNSMRTDEWQAWYERFKPLVERSHREILKQVL